MEQPSKEQIKKFVETFKNLSEFEGQQRFIRGYGLWNETEVKELAKEIIPVREWLESLCKE